MILNSDRVDRLVLLEWQHGEPPPRLDPLPPPGLPSAAVLLVRRVAVVAVPASVPAAVAAEVADAAGRATRPVRGEVDMGADAVVFADEAELLACYLLAVGRGRLDGWVWNRLAGVLPPPIPEAVLGDADLPLAAVLATLAAWQCSEEPLAGLAGPARFDLLGTLARQHDLWVRAVAPRPVRGAASASPRSAAQPPLVLATEADRGSPASYDVGRAGSAQVLARVVSGAGFAASLTSLVALLLGRTPSPPTPPSAAASGHVALAAPAVLPDVPHPHPGSGAPDVADASGGPGRDHGRPSAPSPALAHLPSSEATTLPTTTPTTGPAGADRADGVPTGLAGVFYLVNAGHGLDLRALGLADAAPWDVVDGLARTVLGSGSDQWREDPVWSALQALAGRSPGEPPAPHVLERCSAALTQVLDDLALTTDEPTLAELVAVPGRLVVDRAHVEVLMALDAIDLAARRRALDADPGWVPALGRVIRFHFLADGGPR